MEVLNLKTKLLFFLLVVIAIIFYTYDNKAESERSDLPTLHSSHAIILNDDSGNILLDVGADELIYPASITKIMTAILAIEYFEDLDEKLEIDDKILSALAQKNASVAGFEAGETVTVEDLLYGTLLASGADATTTLANAISGSEENFAEMMNDKAIVLKMNNTHFVNASGLHNTDHFSTVNDLAKLLIYALENKTFKKIFTTESYLAAPSTFHPDGLQISSSLFRKVNNTSENDWKLLGGKTGYTPEAGICLASYVEKNGNNYLVITVGAKGQASNYPYHVEDAITIYNWI